MKRNISKLLQTTGLLTGILLLGWAAQAQTSNNNSNSSDTTHRYGMHRPGYGANRADRGHGRDSLARAGGSGRRMGNPGFRPGMDHFGGGQGAWAGRGPGGGGRRFGRPGAQGGRGWAGRGPGIRYTPEQRRQMMAINNDYRKKAADLFQKDNITLKEYKAGLVALQKEKKTKLDGLLTQQQKDQQAQRRKLMAENMQVMEAARMERLRLRLSLSDDQVARIKTGQAGLRAQMQSLRDNQDLLPQQKMEQMKG